MTTFRVNLAMSLDGYIADRDGRVDWLGDFDPEEFGFGEFLGSLEAIACGAATYEQLLTFECEWPYRALPFHVLATRSFVRVPVPSVEVHSQSFEEFLHMIDSRYGGDVWILGGGRLMRSFLEAGVPIRIELHVIPVLLGQGIGPFAGFASGKSLRRVGCESLSRGVTRLIYESAGC
jgi:dihydrofolate reductase